MARKFPNSYLSYDAHYIGDAIRAGGTLMYYCPRCGHVFRVSMQLINLVKGSRYVLLDKRPLCRIARCGGRGHYLYAVNRQSPLVAVTFEPQPYWRKGPCPDDFLPQVNGDGVGDDGGDGLITRMEPNMPARSVR
ncbi:MAG: hypothetical protein V2J26_11850 [Pacificimonas sp.]|nr:hypothetical protein [Pacificimonas sp.]